MAVILDTVVKDVFGLKLNGADVIDCVNTSDVSNPSIWAFLRKKSPTDNTGVCVEIGVLNEYPTKHY